MHHRLRRNIQAALLALTAGLCLAGGARAENLKPFVLAETTSAPLAEAAQATKQKLEAAGFEVVGDYAPYEDARILVVTNEALKTNAAKSERGGYGAVQRISLTRTAGGVQIAFTNPRYMANAYRLKNDLSDVEAALKSALGFTKDFGSEKGLPPKKLRKYHYMFMMPYFDDQDELASYPSHEEALKKVESGLANKRGGAEKVYRVDLPGKDESVFGVALPLDEEIMKTIDQGPDRHTAHLCYELLVSGKKAYALKGKFRIALNFPDLTMGTFMKISSAPSNIMWALRDVALDRKKQD